jgi:hypothetical protein
MGHSEAFGEAFPGFKITETQFHAIELTLLGMRDLQIADRLNINRKTLWRWRTLDTEYIRALEHARTQLYSDVADRFRTLLLKATLVMAKFLDDKEDGNRFRSAYALLMMAAKFRPAKPDSPDLPPDFYFAPELRGKLAE